MFFQHGCNKRARTTWELPRIVSVAREKSRELL
jgi:hypothetical protein